MILNSVYGGDKDAGDCKKGRSKDGKEREMRVRSEGRTKRG